MLKERDGSNGPGWGHAILTGTLLLVAFSATQGRPGTYSTRAKVDISQLPPATQEEVRPTVKRQAKPRLGKYALHSSRGVLLNPNALQAGINPFIFLNRQ